MDDAPLVAEGTEQTVEVVGRKIVVRRRGVKTLLQRGFALYRDPKSFVRAFDGPSKKVITAALAENKELAKVIAGAVKGSGGSAAAEDAASPAQAIAEAFKHNRKAVIDAIKANDGLVKDWLRDHKDLAGIVLKGDIHVFIEDLQSVALASAPDGRRVFVLMADGQQHAVPYAADHDDEFRRLCTALRDTVGPLTELVMESPSPSSPFPPPPESSPPAGPDTTAGLAAPLGSSGPAAPPGSAGPAAAPAAPDTKTCPMCAEEIKAAAILCRFCGHRFDQ